MVFSDLKKLDKQYIANTYKRAELDVEKGTGSLCSDADGREYVDFSSGIGVNCFGFTNANWVTAVKDQIDKLGHMSNLYYTHPQVELAKLLCEKTGMESVFFANSGAEANEGAIKTARKYGCDKYGKNRYEIITLENSFHGRTIATLAATGQDVFHKNFAPFPAGFVYAKANDIADVAARVTENTCAIMLECIQGEGGVVPLTAEFLAGVRKICDEKDILLIVDEVQTGVGRTGKFLCSQYFDINPDIVTLAKGLGGGLPIGAVLFGEKTKNTLGFGDHGSTFGGNPVICAGAVTILNSIDGKLLDSVIEKGRYIEKKVLAMDGVKSVSGMGLMLGIEVAEPLVSSEIVAECMKKGLILLTAKHKLRMLPPLNIEIVEIDKGLSILEETLVEMLQRTQASNDIK